MPTLKLYMLLLGCRPKGRHTEQHDIFFGVANSLKELIPEIKQFWPEVKGNIHIDAWREVTAVDGYIISIIPKQQAVKDQKNKKLFFINLGGYRENEFDEFHYKVLTVADSTSTAAAKAKKTTFYKQASLKDSANHQEAYSHVDEKFGIDVDELYDVREILSPNVKEKYIIQITEGQAPEDACHLGYTKLISLK